MLVKSTLEQDCHKILEEKGGRIADEARGILLKEKSLVRLRSPLQYISENWRDPLTPSLVILSCEAVGGKPNDDVRKAALALTLMSLSFNLWDDIVDKTMHKGVLPTVPGKFGEGVALIIGGLASAKAFSILSKTKKNESKYQAITKLVWDYWRKLAKAETVNLELRKRIDVKPEEKLRVIEMQAINLETSSKIGAVLGNGSKEEIEHLGNYGRYLGAILELRKDFNVSVNLTIGLSEKIKNGALPYTVLWARTRSEEIRQYLPHFTDSTKPKDIKELVKLILDTKALENTIRILDLFSGKAKYEIAWFKDRQSATLLAMLAEGQPKLFLESLSTLLG